MAEGLKNQKLTNSSLRFCRVVLDFVRKNFNLTLPAALEWPKSFISPYVPDGKWLLAQRVRLDCDREASYNLNHLLYKPGEAAVNLLVMEISL